MTIQFDICRVSSFESYNLMYVLKQFCLQYVNVYDKLIERNKKSVVR
jgi:hypothetical protein